MPAIRSGRVRAALLLGIFLLMLLGNVLTPYAVDDWAYMHSFAPISGRSSFCCCRKRYLI